ncbi:diphthamide synthesis protein [Candidatus Woesearchaeota archaeon]|nr:diphthamide synthesis protein [Candidatus Woesearchaeota archaeon]
MDGYDLELERVAQEIKHSGAKTVCLQLPDGLKPKATAIADELGKLTGAEIVTWLGSCWGACDTPPVENLGVDLLVQWGHSAWP